MDLNPRSPDETGKRYGMLTVLGLAQRSGPRRGAMWRCICDCGNERSVFGTQLRRGTVNMSCGCQKNRHNVRHGLYRSQIYSRWKGMVKRCRNPNDTSYPNYGGRGIQVCDRWLSFENFLSDMGHPPPGMSLDRIDPNGDYEPNNCRWADASAQADNRRNSRPRIILILDRLRDSLPDHDMSPAEVVALLDALSTRLCGVR